MLKKFEFNPREVKVAGPVGIEPALTVVKSRVSPDIHAGLDYKKCQAADADSQTVRQRV